jgi:putative membrane protein
MGLAEITPGISGATIAGLLNVYNEFVRIISFFGPSQFIFSLKKIRKNINLGFLIPLLSGMIIAIFLAVNLVDYLITNFLFEFKIFLSFLMILAVLKNCLLDQRLMISAKFPLTFLFGILIASTISLTLIEFSYSNFAPTLKIFFLVFAGFLSFSAFILPGISGSLVLVLLGVYQEVIISLKNFDFLYLSPVILGLLISFLIIPNEIIKGFKKNENSVKVFFSGLIFGSIPSVWLHLN